MGLKFFTDEWINTYKELAALEFENIKIKYELNDIHDSRICRQDSTLSPKHAAFNDTQRATTIESHCKKR